MLWVLPAFWNPKWLLLMAVWDLAIAAAVLLDLLRLPRPGQIRLERAWTSPLSIGNPTRLRWSVKNLSRVRLRLFLIDDLPEEFRPSPARGELWVPPLGGGEISLPILPLARGDVHLDRVYLRYRGLFEFAERWAQCRLEQTVRVYPRTRGAAGAGLYLTRSRLLDLEKRRLRQRGLGREFESLRDFQLGDDLRDVCWTASARRVKLVSRTYEAERSQAVWIVLDCGRLMRARVGSENKLDLAVEAALGLADLALGCGDRVGLLGYGRRISSRVLPGRGASQWRALLEQLAVAAPEAAEADHLRAAAQLLALQLRRALIVWITDLAESAAIPEVVEAATRLQRRHLVALVVISQPELVSLSRREPGSIEEMFQITAAQEVVHRRELALFELRRRGALSLEAPPGGLATTVLNQYLTVKERSLL